MTATTEVQRDERIAAVLALAAGRTAQPGPQPLNGFAHEYFRQVDVEAYPNLGLTVSVDGPVRPEDIRVAENGTPVDLLTVRPLIDTGEEVDVFLAIDTSDSVRGDALVAAISAAKSFVNLLPAGVPVGVLTFSDRPRVLLELEAGLAIAMVFPSGLSATVRP